VRRLVGSEMCIRDRYKGLLSKVSNNTATLEEAKRAKQIRDELGLQ
jgi:hypothetical protein